MPNNTNQNAVIFENNTLNPVARHNARRYVLQAMYQWQVAGTPIDLIEQEFLNYHIAKKLDFSYFKELLHGIPKHQQELDLHMQPFLGRPLNEVDAVELAILRLATYELTKRLDVPYPVIINEALELAKKFGSIDGFKFVNSILDRIAKKIRTLEKNKKNLPPSSLDE